MQQVHRHRVIQAQRRHRQGGECGPGAAVGDDVGLALAVMGQRPGGSRGGGDRHPDGQAEVLEPRHQVAGQGLFTAEEVGDTGGIEADRVRTVARHPGAVALASSGERAGPPVPAPGRGRRPAACPARGRASLPPGRPAPPVGCPLRSPRVPGGGRGRPQARARRMSDGTGSLSRSTNGATREKVRVAWSHSISQAPGAAARARRRFRARRGRRGRDRGPPARSARFPPASGSAPPVPPRDRRRSAAGPT